MWSRTPPVGNSRGACTQNCNYFSFPDHCGKWHIIMLATVSHMQKRAFLPIYAVQCRSSLVRAGTDIRSFGPGRKLRPKGQIPHIMTCSCRLRASFFCYAHNPFSALHTYLTTLCVQRSWALTSLRSRIKRSLEYIQNAVQGCGLQEMDTRGQVRADNATSRWYQSTVGNQMEISCICPTKCTLFIDETDPMTQCTKSVYPFHDGKYEDFEPIFEHLIAVGSSSSAWTAL